MLADILHILLGLVIGLIAGFLIAKKILIPFFIDKY